MKNPFVDFLSVPCTPRQIPLHGMVRAREQTMQRIVSGYLRLVEEEAKDMVWLVEHIGVVRAYGAAVKTIREVPYEKEDIEEFCAELGGSDKMPYMISGPSGIYISALVNHCRDERVVLEMEQCPRTFHFMGYRLPEGKTLVVRGNLGDFAGADLSGGRLVVVGSTGDWCGAGMTEGQILVTNSTGHKTGEWMRGGEIRVDGRVQGVGSTQYGGKIFQQGRLIAPPPASCPQ